MGSALETFGALLATKRHRSLVAETMDCSFDRALVYSRKGTMRTVQQEAVSVFGLGLTNEQVSDHIAYIQMKLAMGRVSAGNLSQCIAAFSKDVGLPPNDGTRPQRPPRRAA